MEPPKPKNPQDYSSFGEGGDFTEVVNAVFALGYVTYMVGKFVVQTAVSVKDKIKEKKA